MLKMLHSDEHASLFCRNVGDTKAGRPDWAIFRQSRPIVIFQKKCPIMGNIFGYFFHYNKQAVVGI